MIKFFDSSCRLVRSTFLVSMAGLLAVEPGALHSVGLERTGGVQRPAPFVRFSDEALGLHPASDMTARPVNPAKRWIVRSLKNVDPDLAAQEMDSLLAGVMREYLSWHMWSYSIDDFQRDAPGILKRLGETDLLETLKYMDQIFVPAVAISRNSYASPMVALLTLEIIRRRHYSLFPKLYRFHVGVPLSDLLGHFIEILIFSEEGISESNFNLFRSQTPRGIIEGGYTDWTKRIREIIDLGEIIGWDSLSAKNVQQFIVQRIGAATLSKPWTPLEKLPELLPSAVQFLLQLRGQIRHNLELDFERMVLGRDPRQIFHEKEFDEEGDRHGRHNDPLIEWVVFRLGREIGANTARTIIDLTERDGVSGRTYSMVYIDPDVDPLPQLTAQGAEAAQLVLNVLVRRWDDSSRMIQRSPVGSSFADFDFDMSFNRQYLPIKRFIARWQENNVNNEEHFKAASIDTSVREEVLVRAEKLDLVDFVNRFMQEFPRKYHARLRKFQAFVIRTQRSLRLDVPLVQQAIYGPDGPTGQFSRSA